jgi:hypothetical protein
MIEPEPLARVIATALEEARRIDVEQIRAVVREELAKAPAISEPVRPTGWMTPPKAAKALGVPLKRVRKLIRLRQAKIRLCDPGNPTCTRIEVNLPSLEAALSGEAPEPIELRAHRGGK